MSSGAERVAVVDIGSNSTRLLVADVGAGREGRDFGAAGDGAGTPLIAGRDARSVTALERHSRVTRLGRGVDLSGQLSDEAIEAACAAIADYAEIWRAQGTQRVRAIATSAVRDAANGSAFIAELRERFDLRAELIDGLEEARLTYRGATAEQPPAAPTMVIDIGGGSTEIVVGSGAEIGFHASLQAGVVRHTERHISGDPPTVNELEALAADVRGLIEAALDGADPHAPPHADAGIAVAGTATSLAAVALELVPFDPARVHGHVLDLETIQHELSRFSSAPLAERREIPGLHPDRAPTIIAGCVILIEAMRAFGLTRVTASEHDILYGAALAPA